MKTITLSQIGLYNPQRLSDETVEGLFVIRTKIFDFIIKKITGEPAGSIPQHYLIVGQRGMGKSTLLKRIEVELRKEDFRADFIPLLFPEEQYNLKNLAEFWLNCLDALADTLEVEKHSDIVKSIDRKIEELQKIRDNEELSQQSYIFFKSICSEIGRRPVLLIDNMSFIFDRFDKAEQHKLRGLLMEGGAPVLVGASAVPLDTTYDYGAPFYDAFQIYYLKRLDFTELLDILTNLARLTDSENVIQNMHQENGRLKALHMLTGGNLRTSVMLFKLIVKGFSAEINDDLEALLDEITPLYKARFEELSPQMQVIVDAIALHWDPIVLEDIRNETRYENSQLSPQLKRLEELGWIERLEAYKAKGKAYQISERFFNIWFLMRRSSRRQKRELYCLSKFLETFYGDELDNIAQKRLSIPCKTIDHVSYNLAMAEVIKDEKTKKSLKTLSYSAIREQSKSDPAILKTFNVPDNISSVLEEEERILSELEKENKNKYCWLELGWLYDLELEEFSKAEHAYLKAIEIDENYQLAWVRLGDLYQDYLPNSEKSEAAYLKALEIKPDDTAALNNLGNLYSGKIFDFQKAESAYLRGLEYDSNSHELWYNLGQLNMFHLHNYRKAEIAFLKVIEFDKKDEIAQILLAELYANYLDAPSKAENLYKKILKFNPKNSTALNNLGNIYFMFKKSYAEAENAYIEAIKSDDNNSSKCNLVFLYRDKLDDYNKAKDLFDTLEPEEEIEDSYWLNRIIFDLYEKNEGIAKENLSKAIALIEGQLPENTQDDWWRFGAVVHKLGYANWFTDILEEQGHDKILAPYYIALKAMQDKNPEAYLNSKAVEFRESSKKLMEIMLNYIS